jgi:hypothetical protein
MAKLRQILETTPLVLALSAACSSDEGAGRGTDAVSGGAGDAGRGTSGAGGAASGAGRSGDGGARGETGGSGASAAGGSSTGGGGAIATGGTGSGGAPAAGAGGKVAGGAKSTGGSASGGSAGANASGGSAGANASGGSVGAGGAQAGTACKRGIAANTPPGAAFFPAITWWYNWAVQPSGANVGIEFTPMIWGSKNVTADLPGGSKYLLTFNEPNFHAQANLTAQQAASYWPMIEAKAKAAHVPIVSPAMNFCGPAENCNGTNPYQYLKDFFAACSATACQVDYVAVHWYNCDLPSLRDYLEPGGNLEGFEQFGKPIWLTEFSCNGSASVANQETFMRAAVPYLESNAHVFRYSWFSAGPIPSAKLINDDGSPTALGKVYAGLEQSCH